MTTEDEGIGKKEDHADSAAQQPPTENKIANSTSTNNTGIAGDNLQYFYEDLVYRFIDKKVSFGMVIDNYEDNDSDSDQDEFDFPPLSKGSVKVSWYPQGYEQVIKERSIGLADRSLMPGDVVRRLIPKNNEDSQHGYCREITVYTDVQQVKTKNVLTQVPNSRLIPLDRYARDLVACLGSWVGSVKEHRTKLTLAVMSCNPLSPVASVIARFELIHTNVCNLKPTEKRPWSTTSYDDCEHFIGQILTIKPADLKDVIWISSSAAKDIESSKKRHHLIVEDLKTVSVGVRWHCQGLADGIQETVPPQPDYLISGDLLKNLKILNVFDTCTSQISDRHYLTVNETDVVESKSKWLRKQSKLFKSKVIQRPEEESDKLTENKINDLISKNLVLDVRDVVVDDGEWSTEDSDSSSGTNSCSSGRVTPVLTSTTHHCTHNHGKKSPVLSSKVLRKKFKFDKKSRLVPKPVTADLEPPKPGQPILVETLCTSSIATVVWQDGTIENEIQSTTLYPIHHLDDQEFFPGDFVIKSNPLVGDSQDLRDYGVVQYMNHAARTALVKWFRTYAALSNTDPSAASPTIHGETEVSVYDLKDHPDFNFRPGTVVIRVAGCNNIQSAAGQVLDNFAEGRISVKWVDGNESMCWPQDLYRVGEYDSDEGELWDDDDDDDDDEGPQVNSTEAAQDASWETQSEDEVICDSAATNPNVALRYKLAANIEKSRDAMARLEDMFTGNPALQGSEVMRKLLAVYKECRYLDRLMGTSIFHEQHFTTLLERAKVRDSRSSVSQRIQQHFQRLFSSEDLECNSSTPITSPTQIQATPLMSTFSGQTDIDFENSSSTLHTNLSENIVSNQKKEPDDEVFTKSNVNLWKAGSESTITPISKAAEILTNIVNVQDSVKVAFDKDNANKSKTPAVDREIELAKKPAELSVQIIKESGDKSLKTLYLRDASSSSVPPVPVTRTQSTSTETEVNSNACQTLCTLIKSRLVIAHAEVLKRLGTADFIHALRNEPDDEVSVATLAETPATPTFDSLNNSSTNLIETPDVPTTPGMQPEQQPENKEEGFAVLEVAPTNHKYHLTVVHPPESQVWIRAVRREFKLLGRALPAGVWVRGYEDRLDILSVMIRGPADTPYEDGLFLFDVQLGALYPSMPPLFHYVSYCSDRLNPNLYEDGKVCVSLLGTWAGRGSEVWGPDSTLLQVIVSIQGLILNAQPYFNEAGYERQKGSALGQENSRMYNEMATLKLVQSMTKLIHAPPDVFKKEIYEHFKNRGLALANRLDQLLIGAQMKKSCSQVSIGTSTDQVKNNEIVNNNNQIEVKVGPAFPLLPASKGFCLSLQSALPVFKESLHKFELLKGGEVNGS